MMLYGEGADLDKEDLKLLADLDELYSVIATYDPENVYNMDDTGSFLKISSTI